MSVHQYIGARYVPRFMGTYDATTQYEALDVVDNGSGTSYISKIPTPPGTPLTDTTHWALYGASSGAIINLQNQIDDMNDGSVPGSLQNQINANDSDIETIYNRLDKNILFIFDSYGGYPGTGGDDLDVLLPSVMRLDSDHHISETRGGIGFTNVNGQGTFLDFLQSFTPTLPDKDKITDVIILGGANDYGTTQANIRTGIANTVAYIDANYPNAKTSIGYVSQTRNFANPNLTPQQIWNNMYTACMAYRSCISFGANYLTGVEYIMRDRALYDSGGVHPNPTGVDKIAEGVRASFESGYVDVKYAWDFDGTFNTNQSDYSSGNSISPLMGVTVKNDITTVGFYNKRLDLVQSAGPVKNTVTKILTISDSVKNVINQANISSLLSIASLWNGSTFVDYVPVRVYIDPSGDISIHLQPGLMANPSATVTNIYIPLQGNIAFDTMMT